MIYDNLIHNESIVEQFKKYIQTNTIPNAFLFYGNEGGGKFGHAVELAHMILSEGSEDINTHNKIKKNIHENINYILPLPRQRAIGKTDSALKALRAIDIENIHEQLKTKLSSPYYKIELEKANTILINSIRDIKKKISLSSYNNQWNIYIIMNAEKLCAPRTEAANALLKILEEPNENNLFILLTSNISQMLTTITSRCTKIFFPKIKRELAFDYLKKEYEGLGEELTLVSSIANGNMTSSLKMADEFKIIFSTFDKAIELLFGNDLNKWNNFSKKIKMSEIKYVLDLLIIFFSDIIIYKEQQIKEQLHFQNHLNQIIHLNQKYSLKNFQDLINTINNTKQNITKNAFSPLLFTSLYIEINQTLENTTFNKTNFETLNFRI